MPTPSHLDPEAIRGELRTAKRHLLRARQIVEEQRERIDRLHAHGHSIAPHEALLGQFERTLATLESHERLLRAELAQANNQPEYYGAPCERRADHGEYRQAACSVATHIGRRRDAVGR